MIGILSVFTLLTGKLELWILTTSVSMFSQDPPVEAAGVDSQFVSHQEAEAGRVQVGAAADDAVLGEAAQFPGHVGQNVHCLNRAVKTSCLCENQRTSEETLGGRYLG